VENVDCLLNVNSWLVLFLTSSSHLPSNKVPILCIYLPKIFSLWGQSPQPPYWGFVFEPHCNYIIFFRSNKFVVRSTFHLGLVLKRMKADKHARIGFKNVVAGVWPQTLLTAQITWRRCGTNCRPHWRIQGGQASLGPL
jgi:hypothetical protein